MIGTERNSLRLDGSRFHCLWYSQSSREIARTIRDGKYLDWSTFWPNNHGYSEVPLSTPSDIFKHRSAWRSQKISTHLGDYSRETIFLFSKCSEATLRYRSKLIISVMKNFVTRVLELAYIYFKWTYNFSIHKSISEPNCARINNSGWNGRSLFHVVFIQSLRYFLFCQSFPSNSMPFE